MPQGRVKSGMARKVANELRIEKRVEEGDLINRKPDECQAISLPAIEVAAALQDNPNGVKTLIW